MERKQSSQNEHPQSWRKSLTDRLEFLRRSGRVDTVPQITSHTPEGYYVLLDYVPVPNGKEPHTFHHHIQLTQAYEEFQKRARGFFLGDSNRDLGALVLKREEIGEFRDSKKPPHSLVWAGVYVHI